LKLFNSIDDAKLLNDIISSKEFEKMIDSVYAWHLEIEQAQNLINKSSLFICKFHEYTSKWSNLEKMQTPNLGKAYSTNFLYDSIT